MLWGNRGTPEVSCREAPHCRSGHLATPNYSYEKRQRELAKKRKAEEKRQRKLNQRPDDAPGQPDPVRSGPADPAPAPGIDPKT